MNRILLLFCLAIATMAGCHNPSDSGPPGTMTADGLVVHGNQLPAGIQASFNAEHPYATISQIARKSNESGVASYTIKYTRPDGSKGKVTYGANGEMISDKNVKE